MIALMNHIETETHCLGCFHKVDINIMMAAITPAQKYTQQKLRWNDDCLNQCPRGNDAIELWHKNKKLPYLLCKTVWMWECGRCCIIYCALWECENARMWECGHVSMWEWWTMSSGHIALCGEKDCCEGVIMLPGQTAYCLANGYKRGLFYHGFSLFRFNKKKTDKWYDKV